MECRSTSANTAMNAKVNQSYNYNGEFLLKTETSLKINFILKTFCNIQSVKACKVLIPRYYLLHAYSSAIVVCRLQVMVLP